MEKVCKRVDYLGDIARRVNPDYWKMPNKPLSEIIPGLRTKLQKMRIYRVKKKGERR